VIFSKSVETAKGGKKKSFCLRQSMVLCECARQRRRRKKRWSSIKRPETESKLIKKEKKGLLCVKREMGQKGRGGSKEARKISARTSPRGLE